MPFINFKCKKCKRVFDFDVGKISFELVDERPQFENQIKCSHCGALTLDEVELTEIYLKDVKLEDSEGKDINKMGVPLESEGGFRGQSPLTILSKKALSYYSES